MRRFPTTDLQISLACLLSCCGALASCRPIATPVPVWTPTSAAFATPPQAGGLTPPPPSSEREATPDRRVERPLSPVGPWLVGSEVDTVVVLNLDGTGRTTLIGPSLWEIRQDIAMGDGFSTSGWIAARTGLRNDWNAGEPTVSEGAVPASEVGITLWRLPGTEPFRVIPRFSDELLAGMGEIRDFDLPYGSQATGPRWKYDMVFLTLLRPEARLFWSPDGRYLAFAAALDGPSADVYAYDSLTDEVHRLTDGPNQAVLLGWSPDGRWVLHVETTTYLLSHGEIMGFPAEVLWAAAADGSQVRRLGSGDGRIVWISGWLSPQTVVLTAWWGGSTLPRDLWSIDLDTGTRQERQDFSFYSAAVDPGSDTIAVNADVLFDTDGGLLDGGLFLMHTLAGELMPVDLGQRETCYACEIEWLQQLGSFIIYFPGFMDETGPPLRLLPTGEVQTRFAGVTSHASVSPNGTWMAFTGQGIRIYDSQGLRIGLPGDEVRDLVWAADSSSLYYLESHTGGVALRLISLPGGESSLLNPDAGLEGLYRVQAGHD